MRIERLNPAGLHANRAYSHGVAVPGGARWIHVGGQNGVDAAGGIVGHGDVAAQTTQALANVSAVLAAGGAAAGDLVSLSVYVVGDADIGSAFVAWQAFWADRGPPPLVKLLRIVGLASPDFLIEIEALAAVVPETQPGRRLG